MKRRLTIFLRGGLGNQLFQLLTCISIAENADLVPCVVVESFNTDKYGRRLEVQPILELFDVLIVTASDAFSMSYLHEAILTSPMFFSKTHNPLSNKRKWPSDYILDGYFLDFSNINPSIIEKFVRFLDSQFRSFNIPKDYSFIHTREKHGHTKKYQPKTINSLPYDYYLASIDLLFQKQPSSSTRNVLIFSDLFSNLSDSQLVPLIANRLESYKANIIYADQLCACPLEILSIMAKSSSSIVANSSLSVLGSLLSNSFLVYSPRMSIWENELNVPSHWHIVDTNIASPITHSNVFTFYDPSLTFSITRIVNIFPYKTKKIISLCIAYVLSIIRSMLRFGHSFLSK